MKKNRQLPFTEMLYVTYLVATIVSLYISYSDLDSNMAFNFVLGYLFFTFFMLIYIPVTVLMNVLLLKWVNIRKSLFKFLTLFILFSVSNLALNYIFRPASIDVLRTLSVSFGISFGIAFFDFLFLGRKHKR